MFNTFTKTPLGSIVTSGAIAISSLLTFGAIPAHSFKVYFGEDLNNSARNPLSSSPEASAAQADFLANLNGVGTENFESFSNGSTPLNLSFPGSTGNITATLSGGNGSIETVNPGTTNGYGRYATSGSKYWEVIAGGTGNFQVALNTNIGAFGFFGIDIGDFGGQLQLELSLATGGTEILTVDNTPGSWGSTDGSVIFYGIIAENASEVFNRVSFLTTTGQGDVFAFDDMTVAQLEQVTPVPEPLTILGSVVALGYGVLFKKKLSSKIKK